MSILDQPGDLAQTPLAALLIEALNLRASGVLRVIHGGGTSRLWFRDGRPVGAQVFAAFKPLGMMLLEAGLIDVDDLSRSLAKMAESRRPQGEILIEMGVVSAEDVARTLAEQQAGYFALIAGLEAGSFSFDATAPVPEWTRGLELASPVQAHDGDEAAGIAIRREDVRATPRSSDAPPPVSPAARRSDPAEGRARRQRLLQQAMRNMGIGPFAGRATPPAGAVSDPVPPASGASASEPGREDDGETAAEAQLREALVAVAPRACEKDLFARLGLSQASGREEVKRAFLALVRQFHPDRFASPALADLQELVKEFFASVNEAYEVLSDDRKRAEYLKLLEGRRAEKRR